jgi:hypothetical protein
MMHSFLTPALVHRHRGAGTLLIFCLFLSFAADSGRPTRAADKQVELQGELFRANVAQAIHRNPRALLVLTAGLRDPDATRSYLRDHDKYDDILSLVRSSGKIGIDASSETGKLKGTKISLSWLGAASFLGDWATGLNNDFLDTNLRRLINNNPDAFEDSLKKISGRLRSGDVRYAEIFDMMRKGDPDLLPLNTSLGEYARRSPDLGSMAIQGRLLGMPSSQVARIKTLDDLIAISGGLSATAAKELAAETTRGLHQELAILIDDAKTAKAQKEFDARIATLRSSVQLMGTLIGFADAEVGKGFGLVANNAITSGAEIAVMVKAGQLSTSGVLAVANSVLGILTGLGGRADADREFRQAVLDGQRQILASLRALEQRTIYIQRLVEQIDAAIATLAEEERAHAAEILQRLDELKKTVVLLGATTNDGFVKLIQHYPELAHRQLIDLLESDNARIVGAIRDRQGPEGLKLEETLSTIAFFGTTDARSNPLPEKWHFPGNDLTLFDPYPSAEDRTQLLSDIVAWANAQLDRMDRSDASIARQFRQVTPNYPPPPRRERILVAPFAAVPHPPAWSLAASWFLDISARMPRTQSAGDRRLKNLCSAGRDIADAVVATRDALPLFLEVYSNIAANTSIAIAESVTGWMHEEDSRSTWERRPPFNGMAIDDALSFLLSPEEQRPPFTFDELVERIGFVSVRDDFILDKMPRPNCPPNADQPCHFLLPSWPMTTGAEMPGGQPRPQRTDGPPGALFFDGCLRQRIAQYWTRLAEDRFGAPRETAAYFLSVKKACFETKPVFDNAWSPPQLKNGQFDASPETRNYPTAAAWGSELIERLKANKNLMMEPTTLSYDEEYTSSGGRQTLLKFLQRKQKERRESLQGAMKRAIAEDAPRHARLVLPGWGQNVSGAGSPPYRETDPLVQYNLFDWLKMLAEVRFAVETMTGFAYGDCRATIPVLGEYLYGSNRSFFPPEGRSVVGGRDAQWDTIGGVSLAGLQDDKLVRLAISSDDDRQFVSQMRILLRNLRSVAVGVSDRRSSLRTLSFPIDSKLAARLCPMGLTSLAEGAALLNSVTAREADLLPEGCAIRASGKSN